MAKQQKHTARDNIVPNKKTVAATKEARRGGIKSVKNLEELFKALDEDEAALAGNRRGFQVFVDGERAYVRSGVAMEGAHPADDDADPRCSWKKPGKKGPT